MAAMKAYDQQEINRINKLGEHLREGFREAFNSNGVKGTITGLGSLAQIHWGEGKVKNARDSRGHLKAARDLPQLLHLELMNRGIFIAPRGFCCISTPMTVKEIDQIINTFHQTLDVLKQYMESETPFLLS